MAHHDATAHPSAQRPSADIAERLLLIVEDDVAQRAIKIRALALCKQVSVLGASSQDCVDVALTVSPRALLIEATESGEIGPNVHRVLERDHRISAVILGHDRAERARRKYPRVAARFHGMATPIRAEEVAAFIAQPPLPESWAGFFTPAECLQAAGIGAHSLSIDCIAANGSRLGSIAMDRGTILHAQTSSRTGFEAFRELVTSPGVRAVMRPPVEVEPQPDLAGGWELVLLEALRVRDPAPRSAAAAPEGRSPAVEPGRATRASGPAPDDAAPRLATSKQDRRAEAQAHIDRAIQAVLVKDYDAAVEALELAGRLDPENPSIQPRLARLYARNSTAR
jgi:hypothetical protein